MIKISKEEFIKKSSEVHEGKYDYSLVDFKSLYTKIKIICPEHGIFQKTCYEHLFLKQGCPKCSKSYKLTYDEFVEKAREVHGNRYDYSLNENKIEIKCSIHGVFKKSSYFHLYLKRDCPKCSKKFRDTKESFIEKARKIHEDKYDYSLVEYVSSRKLVKVICSIHGVFEISPDAHLNNRYGCRKCGKEKKRKTLAKSKDEFEKEARKIHGDKYDYSLVEYINSRTDVKIICPIHGIFEINPGSHIYDKRECTHCQKEKEITTEVILNRFKEVHKNRYDYSLVEYVKGGEKVKIICPIHGVFKQTPNCHSSGEGCPICKSSTGEIKVYNYLEKEKIKFIPQFKFKDCRNKKPLPFDFYLPEHGICIEYDGKQHFEPLPYFGGEKAYIKTKENDSIKTSYCNDNNLKLLRISYQEKEQIDFILEKMLKNT